MREDWIECTLGDLFILIKNGSNIKQTENNAGIPVSRIETIWNESIDWNRVKYALDFDKDKHSQYLLIENDILFSHINSDSHLGKTAIFREKNKQLIHGINLLLMRPHRDLVGLFLLYFLRFHKYSGGFLDIAQRSVNQSSINQTSLKKVALSLPSKPEQRAIVKKLESLLSSLDAGVADLKKAQQQLKMYRQAVLKKAFEREFETVRIGDVLNLSKEKHKPGKPESLFYIGLDHIEKHTGKLTEKVGFEEINTVKNKFRKDDILYGKLRPNLNKVYLANECGVCSTDILVFTPSEKVVPKFVMKIMLSRGFVNDMSNNTSGVNLPRVSTKYVENYLIPLPSIEQQKEIVKQIESRLSVCDSIEQNIKESLEKAQALRQSILKKAFEGNLLTAEELEECKLADDYEPANVLLERIKAEQTEIKAKPSKKKPRHSVAKYE